ncbi:MAG: TauD/TfdA family dioxygenase [Alphaproteobacteria bacterium]|jgi:alpha-ketoglutarate-dependent taurine dioxygenase
MRLQPTGIFDNSARTYAHIEVLPLAAAMGAEIRGADLARIDDATFAEIADALYRHKMIFFRDQRIGHADQEAFTLRFGPFGKDAYTKGLPDHPNIQPVIKEADTSVKMIFGEGWHTDSPFLAQPPAISILRGEVIPAFGGDTIWCNAALAYAALSDTMKAVLAPLRVRMSAADVIANMDRLAAEAAAESGEAATAKLGNVEMSVERQSMIEGSAHPLVRTHPVTGEKALYVDETYAQRIEGMTDEESKPLLDFLRFHVTQASFQCRLRWQPGTLALWDNRLCIHQAFNDYDGESRVMYRTTVAGEAPA